MSIDYSLKLDYEPLIWHEQKCPDTLIWGPELWKIYHSLLELNNLSIDNLDIIYKFIKVSLDILPCKYCLKKTKEYINNNNFPINIIELKEWIWDFHNYVNIMNNKNMILIIEENIEQYKNISLTNSFRIYLTQLYQALELNWINYDIWYNLRNNIIPELFKVLNINI